MLKNILNLYKNVCVRVFNNNRISHHRGLEKNIKKEKKLQFYIKIIQFCSIALANCLFYYFVVGNKIFFLN